MKKLMLVLLTLAMVLGCFMVTNAANDEVSFGYCGYVSPNGDIIEGFNDEAYVQGFAIIYNDDYINTSLALTIAHYDVNDRLVSIKSQTVNVTDELYRQEHYSPVLECTGGEGSYFRLFITKDLLNLKPLEAVPALPWFNKPDDIRVSYKDIDEITYSNGVINFSYWKNDTDRKPTTVTIFAEPDIYINEVQAGWTTEFALEALSDFYGYVTLSKKLPYTSEDYDFISIEDYETIVVDVNATGACKLLSKNYTTAVSYDPYNDNISAKLYDEEGNELEWESLKENDVVTIKRYTDYDETYITGIKQTPNIVTGVISGIDGNNKLYQIGDNEYGIDLRGTDDEQLTLGFEAIFYIDVMGNITYYEEPPVQYAYISRVGSNGSSTDERTSLRVYTSEGKFTALTTASTVKVDGVPGLRSAQLLSDIAVTKNQPDSEYLLYNHGSEWYNLDSSGCITGVKAIAPGQVITYKTNTSGYVTVIDRPSAECLGESFTQYYEDFETLTYNNDYLKTDNGNRVYVTDDTIIMVAPTLNSSGSVICPPEELVKDDFKLVDLYSLNDEQIFENAMAYNVDADRIVPFIVVNTLPTGVEYIVPEEDKPAPPDIDKVYYGYVSDIGDNGNSLDPRTIIKLYTTDDEYVTLSVASGVRVDGVSQVDGRRIAQNMYMNMSEFEYEKLVRKQGDDWFSYNEDYEEVVISAIQPGQVIAYMVNSSGYISLIDRPDTDASIASFKQYSIMTETIEYSADENALVLSSGIINVTENTKIMIAPTLDKNGSLICWPEELTEEDFALFDISKLSDGQRFYNATLYIDIDAEFILVNSPVEMAEPMANMALVKSVGATEDENYCPIYSLNVLREGEAQTLYTIDDSIDAEAYSTILPNFDMNGKVVSADVLAVVTNNSTVTFNNPHQFTTEDTKFYYGKLSSIKRNNITIGNETITVPWSANVYIYNSGESSKNRVTIDDLSLIDYDEDDFWIGKDQYDIYAVVREHKGEVVDVVLYAFIIEW